MIKHVKPIAALVAATLVMSQVSMPAEAASIKSAESSGVNPSVKTLEVDTFEQAAAIAGESGGTFVELPLSDTFEVSVDKGFDAPAYARDTGYAKLSTMNLDTDYFESDDPYVSQMSQLWYSDAFDSLKGKMKGSKSPLHRKVRVAVIDSGIDQYGLEFKGKVSALSKNIHDGNTDLTDEVGHGSMVSSIIMANRGNGIGMSGIADDCELITIKVGYMDEEEGYIIPNTEINEAMHYAAACDADVVNMSLGTPDRVSTDPYAAGVESLQQSGAIIVASAGNEKEEITKNSCSHWPAANENVVCVGASYGEEQPLVPFDRAVYSNYGSEVDVWAPGIATAIQPNNMLTQAARGTSFAAPSVSATIARYIDAHGRVSVEDILARLKQTSVTHETDNRDALQMLSIRNFLDSSLNGDWACVDNTIYDLYLGSIELKEVRRVLTDYTGSASEVVVPKTCGGKDVDLLCTKALEGNRQIEKIIFASGTSISNVAKSVKNMPELTCVDASAVSRNMSLSDLESLSGLVENCPKLTDVIVPCTASPSVAVKKGTWKVNCPLAALTLAHRYGEWVESVSGNIKHLMRTCLDNPSHVEEKVEQIPDSVAQVTSKVTGLKVKAKKHRKVTASWRACAGASVYTVRLKVGKRTVRTLLSSGATKLSVTVKVPKKYRGKKATVSVTPRVANGGMYKPVTAVSKSFRVRR